jgi:branched-chain amino acid transport system ATP-binding protein
VTVLLATEGLEAFYGASQVLHGIALTVRRGEQVALMGRNGMGKTTLLRAIMGLGATRRGQILLDGRDVCSAPPEIIARCGVALVPEGRGVFGSLSVVENLVMAARPGRDGRRHWTLPRVFELFPRLAERRRNGGHQLSGGEQQMLAIGRALVTNPRLLILDEATEGLAPLVREEIWRCLATLRRSRQAILVIDKYVQRLIALADRHVILEKGRVAWSGSSAELDADRTLWARYLGV